MKLTCILAAALLSGLLLAGCSKEDPKSYSKVDYNKDGKVIFEELIVVFPDLTVDEFLAADADNNGSLDDKEYGRLRQARRPGMYLALGIAMAAVYLSLTLEMNRLVPALAVIWLGVSE